MSADQSAEAIARFHRENAAAWRKELEIRLLWPELAGGSLSGARWTPFDADKAMRAGAAFGLVGGELCGCHVQGCELCLSNGGCGDEDCGPCENSLRAYKEVVARYRAGQGLDQIVVGDGQGKVEVEPAQADTTTQATSASYVDAHVHLRGPESADWSAGDTTELDSWIDATATGLIAQGVAQAILSVQPQVERDSAYVNGRELDDVCTYAADRHPTLFVPFARGFDPGSARARIYVQAALESGAFEGIGELLVHDASDAVTAEIYEEESLVQLVQVFTVAANLQKVVMVHWNMGSIAYGYSTVSRLQSFQKLRKLLMAFPIDHPSTLGSATDPMPLKLILAHCGAGPDANRLVPDHADFLSFLPTYEAMLDTLLAEFPNNLYFDLAGMQTAAGDVECLYDPSTTPPTLTDLGDMLLMKIAANPGRFLIGTDVIGSDTTTISDLAATYANYVTYLSMTARDTTTTVTTPEQVLSTNWTDILADVL